MEIADYSVTNYLMDEHTFTWWLPHTLKNIKKMPSNIKSKYWDKTHKYGIKSPYIVGKVKDIDKENGIKLYQDTII